MLLLLYINYPSFLDRKFNVKARLSQAIGVTMHLLRQYISHSKVVLSLLQVIKIYSNNGQSGDLLAHYIRFAISDPNPSHAPNHAPNPAPAVNACYLGKNGAISQLFRILSSYGRKHLNHVRSTLDTLVPLLKSS